MLPAGGRLWIASEAPPPPPPAAEAAAGDAPAWARFAAEPPAERGLRLVPYELDGSRGVDRRVGVTERSRPAGVADFPLLLLVLMVATAATFIFWRRDPKRQQLKLDEGQRLATVGSRLAAAGIDLAPGFLGAWLLFSAEPAEIFAHWPGLGRPSLLVEVVPPLFLVVVTVLHTGLAEALTGRSLGKALLRLRVTDLAGRRVTAKRALARMLLKPVDLLAVLLLVLPLINPHRQRLCDLVAGTVVLAEDEAEAEKEETDAAV